MTDSRRLAAIMFTDMVGYSSMTQRDEALALALLGEHQHLLRPIFAGYGGREVKATGDGFLVEFASALQALRCAIAIQTAMAERSSSVPLDRRIELRIGLHLGDVEVRDGDVFGDGVNIAARIEPLADPGGVCITGPIFDQVRNKTDEPLVLMEKQRLKNIDVPIDVYRVVLPWTTSRSKQAALPQGQSMRGARVGALATVLGIVAVMLFWRTVVRAPEVAETSNRPSVPETAASPAAAGSGSEPAENEADTTPSFGDRPAIAVLPFDNLSADPDQAFFADGLAEDLITRLSTWRSFPVIARNSSFQYRGGNRDLKEVGSELGARYVVEGSVRRAGNRIRVTAQLIDALSGEHLWAETYDREVEDVFSLQDEISSTVAASIAGDVSRAEGERARRRGTENLEAWSLFQLGQQHLDRITREDTAVARSLFEQAAEADPRFATALASVAMADLYGVLMGWSDAPEQLTAAALVIARRAAELDPRDPATHTALAGAYLLSGDLANASDAARRAVDLNPSMPAAWIWLGWMESLNGNAEAGIAASKRAQTLDPQGRLASMSYDNIASTTWETGRYQESLEASRRLIAARPGYWMGYVYLALGAASLGHDDEARAAIAEARRIQPNLTIDMIQRSYGASRPEIDARRDAALRKLGLT